MQKSAILELNATKQGLLLPRLSDTTSINALNPPDGMEIYFIPIQGTMIRSNGAWHALPKLINGNLGIATTAPTAKLDAAGTYKLGAKGSVNKNEISFVYTVPSTVNLPAATSTGAGTLAILLLGNYNVNTTTTTNAGAYDMSITLVTANQPTTTQATVVVSPAFDLPANINIAFARVSATNAVKIRFQNNGTSAQTLTAGQQFYITITEF